MKWISSELLLVALRNCRECKGTGVRREKRGEPVPCGCALRGIFRMCYRRFKECAERGKCRTQATFDRNPRGRSTRGAWGRKEEEYIADFELVSRRSLDEAHYKLFRFHFLLGADWQLCCTRLGLDRGNFFHAIYRIEERLGFAFYQTKPYALFPPNDYFIMRRLDPGSLTETALLGIALDASKRMAARKPFRAERLSA